MLGPRSDEVLVQTLRSAISAGTELLVYRGEFPRQVADAESADVISHQLEYPLPYGYAAIGRVVELGAGVDRTWQDRLVLGMQPHASHFVAAPERLVCVPADTPAEDAAFLPNMETAVNLVQDAAPILGERALVMGQGVVGLLTAALLNEFPLIALATADRLEIRRSASRKLGVRAVLDPSSPGFREVARQAGGKGFEGYDLVLEISGDPQALNDAIYLTRFSGRIIVASWYGLKTTSLDLGAAFHRSRIRLMASQVSTISPELSGRWTKGRRFEVAWDAVRRHHPASWITHRFKLEQAASAYSMLDRSPEEALQVVFEYG